MKTVFKKISLSLAAIACVATAGAGVALGLPTATANADAATLADRDFYISGTGVRLINDKDGAGLRFHTNLLASEYANVTESGTLIIPEFRYDGELTLDDLNKDEKNRPTHIVTKGVVKGKNVDLWTDCEVGGDAFKKASVYLYDIPEAGYGTRMVVVSYVKIDGSYVYTSVLENSNYISLSNAATKAIDITDDANVEARLSEFVVDDVKVTVVMPDGTKTTQTVAYGSKLTAPVLDYNTDWYNLAWKDQYGNAWDFDYSTVSYPVTLTPAVTPVGEVKQVASKVLGDCYGATAPERAWVNGSTPEVLKSGVPAGFNVLNKFTWYKDSTSIWKVSSNPLYRNCYDDTSLSSYEKVRFMLKLETKGDAYVTFSNKGQVIRNEWLTFELTQNTPGVWSLKVFNESGEVVHQVDNYSRFEGNNDSIRSLVFPMAWTSALGHTFATKLMPATTKDYDVYVYTTEILGYRAKEISVYPTMGTMEVWGHIWNNHYFQGGGQPEGAWSDEAAPSGFTKVSEYSWTSTTSNDMGKVGHFNDSDISAYSDLYLAMKVENGMDIYIQGAPTFYTGGDWLYVHLYQAEDGTWSKDFMSIDGSYSVMGKQKGIVATKLTQLMNYTSGVNTGTYPRLDMTAGLTATAYFTEVRGILKDGSTSVEESPMNVPAEATVARTYLWRDDLYTNGTMTLKTEGAPAGFTSVLEHVWHSSRTAEYTYCFDNSLDISIYSDLYMAMKLENGSHFYVRNSSNGHYTGSDWLYVHYSKNADGTWTLNVESADGFKAYSKQTYTATNLKALMDNNLYAYRTDTSVTTTAYYTEIRAISETGELWGERALWSTVDNAVADDFAFGMPVGFTSLYKKDNFKMNDLATLDLSDGYYDQIRFGLISDQDITLNSAYNYIPEGETVARPSTVISSKYSNKWYTMNVFTLTNLGNDTWQVDVTGRLWYSQTADKSKGSGTVIGTFTYTVSGTTLKQIMSTLIKNFGANATAYCTEVRGIHTHKTGYSASLGNGTIQNYCLCGQTMGAPVAFAHGIPANATTVLPSIWRDDNYALSKTTTMAVPAGFTNVKEYNWLHNTAKEGAAWGASDTNMSTYCINTTDISGYSDLYFALRIVGGKDIYIRGLGDNATYAGGDWLYVHYQQTSAGVWTLSVASVDGYTYVKTGVTGTNLKSLMSWEATNNSLFPRRNADDVAPMVYFTDVRGIASANHVAASYVANGNGTHNVLCECGEVMETANCYGGSATCTLPSICAACNTAYGATLPHNQVWVGDNYVCEDCGKNFGEVNTQLDKQTVALFTNATSIKANVATTATVDLSAVTDLPISSVKSVALDSLTCDGATISNKKVSISVLPSRVFGEYEMTVTVVVEGKEFEISIPVLVVTNMITTNAAMQSLRVVLRGADTAADANGSIGGKGGEATMNGNGYYMLGGNITLTDSTYVYGTSYVPFIGTFDGNGYSLNGYGWANWYGSNQQDISSSPYGNYLEGSLFGVVDGLVKNVAFTNCKFGVFENIMHSGNGVFEDCYMEVIDMNSNANMYTPAIFARQEVYGTGTLRNFVIDYSNFNSPILDAAINTEEIDDLTPGGTNAENVGTRYMSAAGKIYNPENVLVVNFNTKYISVKSGRGNIYTEKDGSCNDGANAGIRAEYVDGTNNGALFSYANLDSKLWKMVDGKPYLIKMSVSGTVTDPSATSPNQNKDELDGYLTNNGTTQYYIAWENNAGATRAARLINNTMKSSTGANLAVGAADVDNLWKKQIVIGSYVNYGDKIDGLDMSALSDDSYGLYLVGKTIFLLAESEQAFDMVGEEFCRRMFGWTEIAPNKFTYDVEATVAIPSSLNYTTEVTFDVRSAAFTNVAAEKTTMNFVAAQPYTQYSSMHNALDYFVNYTGDMTNMLNVNSESDEKGANNEVHGEQLCYTARGNKASFDAMLGHVVSEIVKYAQERPTMTAINFMIEDDPDYCGCATCKQFSNPSITQLVFLNELSYALAHNAYLVSQGRTIAVEFFAYSSFYHAPIMTASDITALNNLKSTLALKAENATLTTNYKQLNTANATYAAANSTTNFTILQAEDNLRLWWTSHKASHSYALTHEANDHMYLPLLAWSACVGAENIDIFMYQTSFWDLQLPLNTWEYQVIWYQELNALGIGSYMFNLGNSYNPAESQTAFSAFKAYIDSRAMTDLNVTFEQLKDEFFGVNGYYGAAGPQMRVFFEELVSAMERKKQDGSASILKDNGDNTTDYVDASQFRYYGLDKDGNPVKASDTTTQVVTPATPWYWRIQAFFNGVYGLSEGSLLFKQKDASHNTVTGIDKNTTATIALEKAAHTYNLYVYGNKTQLETLKAWQQYCVDALKTSGLTEEQIKRIKAEAVFPEYAMLLLYTDYSVTFTRSGRYKTDWTRKEGVTCALQSAAANVTSVSGNTLTYQSLYNMMKSLGFETPSEQYGYNSVSKSGTTQKIGAGWMNMTYKTYSTQTIGLTLSDALYHSAFKNWGVTL